MALTCNKKLSAFLRGIIRIAQKYKAFYNATMPSEDNKILEVNQYQKSDKATVPIEKEVTRNDTNGEELKKKYFLHITNY